MIDMSKWVSVIKTVGMRKGIKSYQDWAIDIKQNVTFKPLPWWFPNKSQNATTWSKDLVYIGDNFWVKGDLDKAGILLHEYIHVVQYREGRLSKWKDLTSKEHRHNVEKEAYGYHYLFLERARKVI